ncbi:MAG: hypothetical protein FJX47_14670 [Alphaproteobacteria bacterium]|nr:hypothetical protein [Alphaproteobacteria bacterium]
MSEQPKEAGATFATGVLAAIVALVGLVLTAKAGDGGMIVFGFGLLVFGVGFVYWTIKRGFDRADGH